MAIMMKCKMCGGDLALVPGSAIATCEYCGTTQTVPSQDDEKRLKQFARANRLRLGCEFDKASAVYEDIIADYEEEAEAYWGLVLCKYGVEYVTDPSTGKKIPTCHRSSFDSVMDDQNFDLVLENADVASRKIYREEAKALEEIRRGIIEVSSKEAPYDIFICYKETDEKGERTLDSVLAQDIYDALTEKGYRTFFARISLEDKLGQEYEPYIFAALNSAKVMLAIGTDYEYYNAVWVKNEWSRFLQLIASGQKKTLIPCFKGIDAYDMPKEFAKLQAQDLGKVGAMQDLLRGIDKLITPAAVNVTTVQGADTAQLISSGSEALQNGEWDVALNRFNMALMADITCVDAHLGKVLAECRKKEVRELRSCRKSLWKMTSFRELMNYADDPLKQELTRYAKKSRTKHIVKSVLSTILIAAVLFVGGSYALSRIYDNTISDFLEGDISAREAYEKFNGLKWYEYDENMIFLAAVGMRDWDAASKQNPTHLTLSQATIGFLEEAGDYLDLSVIESIELCDDIYVLEDNVFDGYAGLKAITIPDSITEIGDNAFNGCTSLTEIDLPDSVTTIGNYAFCNCRGLTEITISVSVKTIGDYAFHGCSGLKQIVLPNSITDIGNYTFCNCTGLTEITIPDSVKKIGDSAFYGCINLTEITIPDSVSSIGDYVFQNCSSLADITIPDGISSIGRYAFKDCTSLMSIDIPDSVTFIDSFAFCYCTSLVEITIPDGVTSIGDNAFNNCSSLKEIRIPDRVKSIGDFAFYGCTSLEEIIIPDSVTSMGYHVFQHGADPQYVYCEASAKLKDWSVYWFVGDSIKVVWGYSE